LHECNITSYEILCHVFIIVILPLAHNIVKNLAFYIAHVFLNLFCIQVTHL